MAKKQTVDARHYDVILAPHITEKSTLASEQNAVVFKVAGSATKPQIKEAIEAIYDKEGRGGEHPDHEGQRPSAGRARPTTRTDVKKAIVTLARG